MIDSLLAKTDIYLPKPPIFTKEIPWKQEAWERLEYIISSDLYEKYWREINELIEVSEWRFQTPEEISKALSKLWASLPLSEIFRLNNELKIEFLSLEYTLSFLSLVENLKENSEWGIIVTKIPKVFTYEKDWEFYTEDWVLKKFSSWEEIPFTINNLKNLSSFSEWIKGLEILKYVDNKTKNRLQNSNLTWWTLNWLNWSGAKNYSEQKQYQKEIFWKACSLYGASANLIVAIYLHYLRTWELPSDSVFTRLDEKDSDNYPLVIGSTDDKIGLFSLDPNIDNSKEIIKNWDWNSKKILIWSSYSLSTLS